MIPLIAPRGKPLRLALGTAGATADRGWRLQAVPDDDMELAAELASIILHMDHRLVRRRLEVQQERHQIEARIPTPPDLSRVQGHDRAAKLKLGLCICSVGLELRRPQLCRPWLRRRGASRASAPVKMVLASRVTEVFPFSKPTARGC